MTSAQQRRAADKLLRRKKIQRVARKIFAERGFQRTTIEDVAKRANLSVGAIYLYFKSKEELYVSLLSDHLDLIGAEIGKLASAEAPAREKLRAAWRFSIAYSTQNPDAHRIFLLLATPNVREALGQEVQLEVVDSTARCLTAMDAIVRAGVRSGEFADRGPERWSGLIVNSFLGYLWMRSMRGLLTMPIAGEVAADSSVDAAAQQEAAAEQSDPHAEWLLAQLESALVSGLVRPQTSGLSAPKPQVEFMADVAVEESNEEARALNESARAFAHSPLAEQSSAA